MNVDRTRAALRPVAYMLQQIVLNQSDAKLSGEHSHVAFWDALLGAPTEIDKLRVRSGPVCESWATDYAAKNRNKTDEAAYPRISKSQDLGYLYVSAALLLFFVGETNTALSLLEDSKARESRSSTTGFSARSACCAVSEVSPRPGLWSPTRRCSRSLCSVSR